MPSVIQSMVDVVTARPGEVWRISQSHVGTLVVHPTATVTVTKGSVIGKLYRVSGYSNAVIDGTSTVTETIDGSPPAGLTSGFCPG